MTALILFLGALTVVGVMLCVVEGLKARHALDLILAENERERLDREVEEQIDDLWLTLWMKEAEVKGWISSRPHDQ